MSAKASDLLVIDDEPVVLEATRKVLIAEGLRPDPVEDGERALEMAATRRYRAVLCDLILPQGSGFELIARIRSHLPGVPIVLITGYATADNWTKGFNLGVFDFIPKPFDDGELLGVVHRALDFGEWRRTGGDELQPDGSDPPVFNLGQHAWVTVQPDGSARIGMGETFAPLNGEVEDLELPEVGGQLLQANQCARWTTRRRLVHRLWSPLSGRVTATNVAAFADPRKWSPRRLRDGWVIELIPSNRDLELSTLARGREG